MSVGGFGDLGLIIMIFVTVGLKIPRFKNKSQKNPKKVFNLNVKWLIIIGNNYFRILDEYFFILDLKWAKKLSPLGIKML